MIRRGDIPISMQSTLCVWKFTIVLCSFKLYLDLDIPEKRSTKYNHLKENYNFENVLTLKRFYKHVCIIGVCVETYLKTIQTYKYKMHVDLQSQKKVLMEKKTVFF